MYVRTYVRMYVWSRVPCPVSRVPESVSLGDDTIGGGARDPESGLIYIYIYIIDHSIHTCTGTYVYEIVHENICIILVY